LIFSKNIVLINKVSPLDILLHTTVLCRIENNRAAVLQKATNGPVSWSVIWVGFRKGIWL